MSDSLSNENDYQGIFLHNNYDGSSGNINIKNVFAENNNDTGLMVLTNGAVTLNGITANNNFKTYGYLSVGDAVSEYYNADVSTDNWGFDTEAGVELTFRLYASDILDVNNFIGVLELYDESGNPVEFATVDGSGTGELVATWTPATSGYYYLLVSEASENNGYYRLSINNEDFYGYGLYLCGMASVL